MFLRLQPSFAISKDGKGGDHLGKAAALHYWTLTMQNVVQICQWELKENALFEVLLPTGSTIVLEQVRGLPIGGHLSAAMVELVALQRKFVVEWLPMLQSVTTSRYRDNCFIVIEKEWSEEQVEACAAALTSLLMIPVKIEKAGRQARCLEVRLDWTCQDNVAVVLAYQTDADRQGESGDVTSWHKWKDPRTENVLHGLLAGLASKLNRFAHEEMSGYTKSIRLAVQWMRQRQYPTKKWLRPFALELLRFGTPPSLLPHCLRNVIWHNMNTPTKDISKSSQMCNDICNISPPGS